VPAQRIGIRVENTELDGILHLPDTSAVGGAAVLHGYGGDPDSRTSSRPARRSPLPESRRSVSRIAIIGRRE